jgi:hypothetical protein
LDCCSQEINVIKELDPTSSAARTRTRRVGFLVCLLVGAAGGGCPAGTQCPNGSCDIGVIESNGVTRSRTVIDPGEAFAARPTGDAGVAAVPGEGAGVLRVQAASGLTAPGEGALGAADQAVKPQRPARLRRPPPR